MRGAEFAVEEINAAGGINGRMVELIEYDDANDPTQNVAMSRKAAYSDVVTAGVLASGSDTCLAGAAVWNEAAIPCVVAWAGHPDITRGAGWIYRIAPLGPVIGRGLATYIYNNFGARVSACIATDDAYEIEVKDRFIEEFEALGGTNVYEKIVEWGQKSYEALLTEILPLGVDVIVGPGDYSMSIPCVIQMSGLGFRDVGYCPLGPSSSVQEFINGVGEIGLEVPIVADSYGDITTQALIDFDNEYKQKYGTTSTFGAWLTYDSVKMLAQVMKNYGTTPEQIKKGLSELKDFVGLAGTVSYFTAGGECLRPAILLGLEKKPDGTIVWYKVAEVPAKPEWLPR